MAKQSDGELAVVGGAQTLRVVDIPGQLCGLPQEHSAAMRGGPDSCVIRRCICSVQSDN